MLAETEDARRQSAPGHLAKMRQLMTAWIADAAFVTDCSCDSMLCPRALLVETISDYRDVVQAL